MEKTFFVRKKAGQKKDAFRVTNHESIPDFLRETVTIGTDGLVHLRCVEGDETCPLGSVIGYEKSPNTGTGYNTWVIGNAATNLIEEDGVFYKKATVMQAEFVSDEFPEFLAGASIRRNDDGTWTITTDWGESTAIPGDALWVRYGTKPDGTPDANAVSMRERAYFEYYLCEPDGTIIDLLARRRMPKNIFTVHAPKDPVLFTREHLSDSQSTG